MIDPEGIGFWKPHDGEYDFAPGDHVEGGGQGNQKTEYKPQEKNSLVNPENVQTGKQGQHKNKNPDARFRQHVSSQTYDNDEKKKEKDFDSGVDPLEKPILGR
jgi:hypothetical protein